MISGRRVKVFRVEYLGFKGANIEGWLAVPEEKGCIRLVQFHGYNWAMDDVFPMW